MIRIGPHICARFQTAVGILGRRWTGLVIQVLGDGPKRFGELRDRLEVVSERMLSERLKELEAEGIVARRVYPDKPVRIEYELTDKGRALGGVMDAIGAWAEEWVEAPAQPRRKRK
jgi:DNA-binding HxlR family transcriptional regulator